MDCRTTLLLALGLACGGAGCAHGPHLPSCPTCNTQTAQNGQTEQKIKHTAPTYVAWAVLREREANNKSLDIAKKRDLYDQARNAYQKALQLDPKHLPAYTGLANVYMKLNRYDKAKETYHIALEKAPNDPAIWFELGICHCRSKEWDQAAGYLRKALELDPDNRFITQTLGFCLARSGHIQESLDLLAKVMTPVEVHYNVARMLYQIHRDDLSLMHLQLAMKIDPNYGPARAMLTAMHKGPATTPAVLPPASTAVGAINLFTPPTTTLPLTPPRANTVPQTPSAPRTPMPAELDFE